MDCVRFYPVEVKSDDDNLDERLPKQILNAILAFGLSVVVLDKNHSKKARSLRFLPATIICYTGIDDRFEVVSKFDRLVSAVAINRQKASIMRSLGDTGVKAHSRLAALERILQKLVFNQIYFDNLGLRHGGGDDDNCKPNLISVMTYTRQMPWAQLSATPTGSVAGWVLTYSRQDLNDLNEASLTESSGLPITTSQWTGTLPTGTNAFKLIWGKPPSILTGQTGASVNWDNDASTAESTAYVQDQNKITGLLGCAPGTTVNSLLKSYDEFAILDLKFRDGANLDGAPITSPLASYPDTDTHAEVSFGVFQGVVDVGSSNISTNAGLSVLPDVAVDGDKVYMVWSDTTAGTSGKFDVLFKKSTDGGKTFGAVQKISSTAGQSLTPRIAISGSNLYVVFSDTTGSTSGKFDIFLKRSTNGGNSWISGLQNISTNTGDSITPHLAVSGANVYLIWSDKTGGNSGNYDILFKKSSNSGVSWPSTSTKLTNNAGDSLTPVIGVSGTTVFAVWSDTSGGTSGNFDIFVKKGTLTSGGTITWPTSATSISTNAGNSVTPHLTVNSAGAWVVWGDTSGGTSGKFDILMKKSSLTGSFGTVKNVSTSTGHSFTPRVSVSGSSVFVVWSDTTGGNSGNFDIYVKKSIDSGEVFGDPFNVSANSGNSNPSMAISVSGATATAHIAWGDLTGNNAEIWYDPTSTASIPG